MKLIDPASVLARIAKMGAKTTLAQGEAVAVVAPRVSKPNECLRDAKNRVRNDMDRSWKRSSDTFNGGLARLPDGRFTVDEISRWARGRYGQALFQDLPIIPRVDLVKVTEGLRLSASGSTEFLPGKLEGSYEIIQAMRAERKKFIADRELEKIEQARNVTARLHRSRKQ